MDYSPWWLEIEIEWNQLKIMQVGFDVICMHSYFDERGLSSFKDKIRLGQMFLLNHYSPCDEVAENKETVMCNH